MAKKRDERTFKEMLAEPTWSETSASAAGHHSVRPGKFNFANEFFDPDGIRLVCTKAEVTPKEALRMINEGAALAYEGCGCGGWGGCAPEWYSEAVLVELRGGPKPRFVDTYGSPTWIDAWEGEGVTVVFAHGDVEWGDAIT